MRQRFIQDDQVPNWLEATEDGHPLIQPDTSAAMELLVAATGSDPNQVTEDLTRILRERDAIPLLSGLLIISMTLGSALFRERRDQVFAQMLAAYQDGDDALSTVRRRMGQP